MAGIQLGQTHISEPIMDGLEVGFFDEVRRDVIKQRDAASACADFVFREASWVLLRRNAGPA
jgi:hypothetical protein